MKTLRKCLHLLFQVLLLLCLANYGYLAWKEYLLLFLTFLAAVVSYTDYGRIMLVPGRFGLNILHVLFFISLFFMTAFPVAMGSGPGTWGSFPPPLGFVVTLLLFAMGLCVMLLGFVGRKAGGKGREKDDDNTGEIGEFMVAILLTLIVVGAITVGVEWLFLPGNVRGARLDSRFLVVVANSLVLLFVCARVFLDSNEDRPEGVTGRLVVSDYRPAFIVVLAALSIWGFYGTGRVLLAEWEAGEAYGAKDFTRAETALRTVERYNSVLRFGALERRTMERLGELYLIAGRREEASECFTKMLSLNPSDTLATIKMIQIEASRGDFKRASALFEKSDLAAGDVRAAKRLDGLLECCPTYVDGQYRLGLLYLKNGMGEKAFDKFAAVVKYNPAHMPALGRLAELMEKRGDSQAAAETRDRMAFSADSWETGGGVLKPLSEDFMKVELAPGLWEVVFEASTGIPPGAGPRIKVRLDASPAVEVPIDASSRGTHKATLRTNNWGATNVHFLFEFDRPTAPSPAGLSYVAAIRNVRFKWMGKP